MKKFDYWDGGEWTEVDEEWLEGVELNGLKQVFWQGRGRIRCDYQMVKKCIMKMFTERGASRQ